MESIRSPPAHFLFNQFNNLKQPLVVEVGVQQGFKLLQLGRLTKPGLAEHNPYRPKLYGFTP